MNTPTNNMPSVRYERTGPAVLIESLSVNDPTVVSESRRWSKGKRGPAVGEEEIAGADLSVFVSQALVVGAHAIGTAGGVQDTFNLEHLVTDVGARTAESTSRAVESATAVVRSAATGMQTASAEAKDAIVAAGQQARQAFAENVDMARKSLLDEVHRLLGGDQPELARSLGPVLDKFSHDLDARVTRQTTELLATAAKQFDPGDPASPMARHARELKLQHEVLATDLEKNHNALATKVEELATAVKVATSARNASERAVRLTPLKGDSYAADIHAIMEHIALGLGDEYADTSAVPGAISRNKKGDGVLTVNGGVARIVFEMTNSKRPNWNDYLAEAERNRRAAASLGLVREHDQNNGCTIRCLGSRRIIMAFDPATGDPELLRTVVQLLRVSTQAAASREDHAEIQTADEKIAEAIALLSKIDDIRRVAGTLRQNAGKIEQHSDEVKTSLSRLLAQAQSALCIAANDVQDDAA